MRKKVSFYFIVNQQHRCVVIFLKQILTIKVNVEQHKLFIFVCFFWRKMDLNLRKSILKTAEGLFIKYGIKSIKVDDICNELHISKKTFYAEFENKEALIEEVWENISRNAPERGRKLAEVKASTNVIDTWLRRPSLAMREHHKKYELFVYDLLKFYPNIHEKAAEEGYAEMIKLMEVLLHKGIEQGLCREDLNVEHLVPFLAKWHQSAIDILLTLPRAEHKKFVHTLRDSWVRVVCSEKGLEYYMKNYYNTLELK